MKRLFISASFSLLVIAVCAQEQVSLFAGYGTQQIVLRGDYLVSDDFIKGSQTRIYIEGGLDQQKFNERNLNFSGDNYSSDSRVFFVGVGFSQQFNRSKFSISPYAGLRYAYARFKDRALVDAIAEHTLIRYKYGQQVGPVVENGYGDTFTFDIGLRLGFHITKHIEIAFSGGIAPVKFNTAATMYGQYWGESPHSNDYYIKYAIWRAEGGLRFHF